MHQLKKPDFFIVGAPKCGTTALESYLSRHPDIFMGQKEMHVFGSDLHFGRQFYRRNLEAYLAEFDARKAKTIAGEASVWYLFSRSAAAEIKAFNPRARIIIMLREPVSMIYSLYHQFKSDGNEQLSSFEEALMAEADRRAGRRNFRQSYFSQGLAYREVARYAKQIQRYFDVFGRENVHVILFDDLAADAVGAYNKVLRFLGVCTHSGGLEFGIVNGSHAARSPLLRNILQDPLVRGTAIALRRWLPPAAFALLKKTGCQLQGLNFKNQKYPPIPSELQLQLKQEFEPEVQRLGALLRVDLSHWSQPMESEEYPRRRGVLVEGSAQSKNRGRIANKGVWDLICHS